MRKIMYAAPSGAILDKRQFSQYLAAKASSLPTHIAENTPSAGLARLSEQIREQARTTSVAVGQRIRFETKGGTRARHGEVDRIWFDKKGAMVMEVWSAGQTRFIVRREGVRWILVRRTW